MAISLGRLERVDPRDVWQHEAHDFTPWLLANADRLSEALGIDIELEAAEHAVGGYSLDLIGRDITNDAVLIVENQLETTDHSHLGQVLTYAAGTAASTIVWLATGFREEHRQALDWLNESTGEETHFFGIELQVVHIGGSEPAPLLNVVVQPNDWQKSVKAATSQTAISGKGALYAAFWPKFLDRVQAEHPDWTRARRTNSDNWLGMKTSLRASQIVTSFAQGQRLRHYLYVYDGDLEATAELYEFLSAHRTEFEEAYGRPVQWEGLLGRKAHGVSDYLDACGIEDEAQHDRYINWFIDAGVRMRRALAAVGQPPG